MRSGKTIINLAFLTCLLEISGFLHLREEKAFPPPKRQTSQLCLGRRAEGSCLFCFATAAGLAHLVEHLTAETQSLKITEK